MTPITAILKLLMVRLAEKICKYRLVFVLQIDRISVIDCVRFCRSVVTATVLYDSNSIVDISQIQKRLQLNNSTSGISIRDNTDAEVSTSTLFSLSSAFKS